MAGNRIAFLGAFVLGLAICNTSFAQRVDSQANTNNESASIVKQLWMQPRMMSRTAPPITGNGGIAGPGPAYSFLSTNNDPEADGPDDVVYTNDGSQVIVVHRETDNITFLNVNTRTVTNTVTVGDFPVDVAVTPNGQFAITANTFGNSISIVDIASHALVTHVPITGQQPYKVAITPDSHFAVVGVINDAINSSFSVVDLISHTEVLTFPSVSQGVIGFYFTPESGGSGPFYTQFALAPDGTTIVCPNRSGSQVKLYNRTNGATLATLNTAAGPTSVALSADGTTAIIGHDSPGNAITKINLVTQTVAASFPMAQPLDAEVIRITPDKSHAIAAISNNAIFVNLTTGVVTTTINTGSVGDIELSFDGQYAFVSNFNCRVINIASQTLVATIPFAACVEAATSPVALRAVALNTRFREDIHFYNINGAASSLEGFALTGAIPEGDNARNLAISNDGQKLVVCHNTSRNVAIVNMATHAIQAYIDVGERPLAAAITPNGQYALVCATDANVLRIIDLTTNTIVSSLSIFSRPSQIRVSADSQFAYVLNVAAPDQISFIRINGAASSILSQISAGETGSAQGYAYTEISGIELSPNGAILAVCDSFNNNLRLYDTATRSLIVVVPVGTFPIRAAFNPAGTRVYVTNAFSNNVSVVNINGAASSVIATVPGVQFPLTINVDAAGTFAYAGNTDSNNPRMYVIDTATNAVVTSLALTSPARDSHYSPAEGILYAALNDGHLLRIHATGATSSIMESTMLSGGPSQLVVCHATKVAVTAQPT